MRQLDLALHAATGERLKREGLDAVESTSGEWVDRMRAAAREHVRRTGSVSVDDLRRHADRTGDQPDTPHAWGAVFSRGGWREVGRKRSDYGSNRAREVRLWALRVDGSVDGGVGP